MVLLWHDTTVAAHELEGFLGLDGFMSVEVRLELDVHESRCVIDEQATPSKHVLVGRLAT
jgi:hypothetical protein